VIADRALEHGVAEAELHEDEDDRERDAGHGDEEPDLLLAELQPREGYREGHVVLRAR
jgi:hypothetical protein